MSQKNIYPPFNPKRSTLKTPLTQKSLRSSHFIKYENQISEFDPPKKCLQHFNDCITHVCLDCQYKCICSVCLQDGNHRDHNIKNIEKSSEIANRILNEYLIRLRSKSDLLTLLKQNMAIRKNQLYSQFKQFGKIIENNFEILANDLIVQKQSLLVKTKKFFDKQSNSIDTALEQIKSQSSLSLKIIDDITFNVQKSQAVPLCRYFSEHRNKIEEILDQDRQKYQCLKNKVTDVKWIVDCAIFDNIREQISSINLYDHQNAIQLFDQLKESKRQVMRSFSKKKSNEKVKNFNDSLTIGCITPKNYESRKNINQFFKGKQIKKIKKSSQSSKLLSMPSSPLQIQTPNHRSPTKNKSKNSQQKLKKLGYKEQMKKNFRKDK